MFAEGMRDYFIPGVDVQRPRAQAPHTNAQEVKGTRAIMKC